MFKSVRSVFTAGLSNTSSFEEAYEITGYGKVNRLALLTCGLLLLSVTTECMGLGYVLGAAQCDLAITVADRGLIGSATLMGLVAPSIVWGYLADVHGRRLVMLPPLVAACLSSACSALAVNFWNIFLLRLLTGLLLSASCSTVYVYLGELHAPSRRAAAIAFASAFIAVSFFSMPAIAWIIMPYKWSVHVAGALTLAPWRAYIFSWSIWSGLAALGLWVLPESPRYLLATKGPDAALSVLAKIYAWNHSKLPTDYPVTKIVTDSQGQRLSFKETILRMRYMVRPPLLRCVLISHYCNFLVFMKVAGFSFWMPHIMNELLHNLTSTGSMCSIMDAKQSKHQDTTGMCAQQEMNTLIYPISMASGAFTGVVYVFLGCAMEKCGKRTVFCGIMVACSGLVLAASAVPQPYVALALLVRPHTPYEPACFCLGGIMVACSGLVMAASAVPQPYVALALLVPPVSAIAASGVLAAVAIEVFPTCLRALALCTLFMVGRMGGALGAHVLALAVQGHCAPVVLAVAAVAGGSSLLMVLWPDADKVRSKMEAQHFIY